MLNAKQLLGSWALVTLGLAQSVAAERATATSPDREAVARPTSSLATTATLSPRAVVLEDKKITLVDDALTPHWVVRACSIAPAAAAPALHKAVATLTAASPKPYTMPGYPNIAVIEEDGNIVGGGDINLANAAKYFYQGYKDDRDFLFVFASTKNEVSKDYNAYYRSLRNTTTGIGLDTYDYSKSYGSNGKLLGVANMNTVNKWKNFVYPLLDLWPLGVITHEMGHQWIAYVKLKSGTITTDPNSSLRSHWDPLAHTEASIMYGNDWKETTPPLTVFGKSIPGTYLSVGLPGGFSSLDKYLMGVHGPEKVKEFFRINATWKNILKHFAIPGNMATGSKVKLTVSDIVAANGARNPAWKKAQTSFKGAFILIAEKGRKPTDDELKIAEYMRKRIPEHFKKETDNRFSISTTLNKK
ncbi:MAG: hypothetical protein HYY84_20185 [Deltaproteobacteria bacterium]|nr:hypothetical protein [Deltaproteobacteria bacterium]